MKYYRILYISIFLTSPLQGDSGMEDETAERWEENQGNTIAKRGAKLLLVAVGALLIPVVWYNWPKNATKGDDNSQPLNPNDDEDEKTFLSVDKEPDDVENKTFGAKFIKELKALPKPTGYESLHSFNKDNGLTKHFPNRILRGYVDKGNFGDKKKSKIFLYNENAELAIFWQSETPIQIHGMKPEVSPDGRYIAVIMGSRHLKVFDLQQIQDDKTPKYVHEKKDGNNLPGLELKWHPNKNILSYYSTEEQKTFIWEADTNKVHEFDMRKIAWSPIGKQLAYQDKKDKKVSHVYDLATSTELIQHTLKDRKAKKGQLYKDSPKVNYAMGNIEEIHFLPDGQHVAYTSKYYNTKCFEPRRISIYDFENDVPKWEIFVDKGGEPFILYEHFPLLLITEDRDEKNMSVYTCLSNGKIEKNNLKEKEFSVALHSVMHNVWKDPKKNHFFIQEETKVTLYAFDKKTKRAIEKWTHQRTLPSKELPKIFWSPKGNFFIMLDPHSKRENIDETKSNLTVYQVASKSVKQVMQIANKGYTHIQWSSKPFGFYVSLRAPAMESYREYFWGLTEESTS